MRLLSAILVFCMAFSFTAPTAAQAAEIEQEASGGVISMLATRGVAAALWDLADRAILFGMAKIGSHIQDETFSQIWNAVRRIMGGGSSIGTEKLTKLCKQIEVEIKELNATVDANSLHTDQMIAQLTTDVSKNEYSDKMAELRRLSSKYQKVINRFQKLAEMSRKYAEDSANGASEEVLNQDMINLKAAYEDVNRFYQDADSSTPEFNFSSDLTDYLILVSPYNPDTALPSEDKLFDKSLWGAPTKNQTYLDYAHDYFSKYSAGEHQMYRLMQTAINESIAPAMTYLEAYRLYSDYKAQLIYEDPSYGSLNSDKTEIDRDADIKNVWNHYSEARDSIYRAIYQINDLYSDELMTMMRDYDVSQRFDMDYHESGTHYYSDSNTYETTATKATGLARFFNVIKPYGKSSVYAIGAYEYDPKITTDLIGIHVPWSNMTCASQDYFNLLSTKSKADGGRDAGFSVIDYADQLGDLIDCNAWSLNNGYFDTFLKNAAGITDIPDISNYRIAADDNVSDKLLKRGALAILGESRRHLDAGIDEDQDFYVVSLQTSKAALSEAEVQIDLEELSRDKAYGEANPVYVIMRNKEQIVRQGRITANLASASLYYVDRNASGSTFDGYAAKWITNNGTAYADVTSGRELEVRIRPNEGRELYTVELCGKLGYVNTLFDRNEDPENADNTLMKLSDGSYVFRFASPYQNFDLLVETIDSGAVTRPNTVTLGSSSNGDLQFESHSGLTQCAFYEGDPITVFARPYVGYTVDTVTITDTNTNEKLDITVTPADTQLYLSTEKAYSFTMPKNDITVDVTYKKGASVYIDSENFIYDKNNNPTCYMRSVCDPYYEKWQFAVQTFSEGETAEMIMVHDRNHYLKSVKAYGIDSRKEYPVTVQNNTYNVTVGKEDIIVYPVFDVLNFKFTASIDDQSKSDGCLYFADENGNSLSVTEAAYNDGDTVEMVVVDDRLFEYGVTVKSADGTDITSSVGFVSDQKTKKITFTMPEQNVVVYVPEFHNYKNGFCVNCGRYETPTLNSDGCYEVDNAGKLFWIAAVTNNDHRHAEFGDAETALNVRLTADIDLENRTWYSIAAGDVDGTLKDYYPDYCGKFDGGGHTVSGLSVDAYSDDLYQAGLFENVASAEIKDLTVKGTVYTHTSNNVYLGGVVDYAANSVISDVVSYVDVSARLGWAIGGIVGSSSNTTIERCVNYGHVYSENEEDAGGIVGKASSTTINDCANIGTVETYFYNSEKKGQRWLGGITGHSEGRNKINNCHSFGSLVSTYNVTYNITDSQVASTSGKWVFCDPIAVPATQYGGLNKTDPDVVSNCYYLDSLCSQPINYSDDHQVTAKNSDSFKSGEVGYLLNNKVTDGTQAWYQNIDNGKTPDDYPLPDKSRGTIYYVEDQQVYSNSPSAYAHDHAYVNGICSCGQYEPAVLNSEGSYEIANAGNFLWYAALVNDEHEHAEFTGRDTGANGVLVSDIDLENRQFINIGRFTSGAVATSEDRYIGDFDGQGHTIENFYADGSYNHWGIFGISYGEIKDLTVKGKIDVTADDVDKDTMLGIVSYAAAGSKLHDITSYIDINDNGRRVSCAGGIIAFAMSGLDLRRCVYFGNIESTGEAMKSAGGIIGDDGANSTIKDCANIGNVTASCGKVSGIAPVIEMGKNTVSDCYNYGSLSSAADGTAPIALSMSAQTTIDNCYYLNNTASGASGASESSVSAEQFASGEIGYLLNHSVTDGTQAWYQNIDNGETPDDYPLPDSTRGTIYYIESENRYSNFPESIDSDNDTETDTSADSESDTAADTETDTSTDTQTDSSSDTETDSQSDTQTDTAVDTDPDTDITSDTETDTATDPETDTSNDTDTDQTTDSDIDLVETDADIQTYEDLVAFSAHVANDYNHYGKCTANLRNNIIAPNDSVWQQAIGSADKPFEGTFNGNGYAIIGLNVNSGDYGGLFGVIGSSGTVRDLHVIDCDFISDSNAKYAGGVAAVNKGTLDHCTSGCNLNPNKKIKLPNRDEPVSVRGFNSLIRGSEAGGITAVNDGTITGCRSGAVVSGTRCAGIACVNNGTIYGCANNGSSGENSVSIKYAGGLVCENNGTIASSYNSGSVIGMSYSTVKGSVAAVNNTSDVTNVFYSRINSVDAIGEGKATGKGCEAVENSDMMQAPFVSKLNNVTDDTIEWAQTVIGSLSLNQGYPTIKSRFLEERTIEALGGITVKGAMHSSLNTEYTQIAAADPEYTVFESVYGKGSVRSAYAVSTTDENGNYVPGEFWSSGVTMTVPVAGNDDVILALDETGAPVKIDNVVIKDGKAAFNAPEAVTFAVVSKSGADNDKSKDSTSGYVKSPNTSTTGGIDLTQLLMLTAVLSLALLLNIISFSQLKKQKIRK